MNPKRLVLAIVVVFVGLFASDFLIHGVWLQSAYKETMNLWRTEAEMQTHMGWLMLGQFLAAATFSVLWAQGFARTGCFGCALLFGVFMGLFREANTLVSYAVQPLPASLAVKWFIPGVAQGVLMGVLAYVTYKPKPAEAKAQS